MLTSYGTRAQWYQNLEVNTDRRRLQTLFGLHQVFYSSVQSRRPVAFSCYLSLVSFSLWELLIFSCLSWHWYFGRVLIGSYVDCVPHLGTVCCFLMIRLRLWILGKIVKKWRALLASYQGYMIIAQVGTGDVNSNHLVKMVSSFSNCLYSSYCT